MKKKYRIITTKDNKSIKKILRNISNDVKEITDEISTLITRMKEFKTNIGVGIAAPQVGENLNIVIVDDKENNIKNIVLINPRWRALSNNTDVLNEGCLSVPGFSKRIERYTNIEVEAFDENMNSIKFIANGFFARVIQHECDHLIGKMICDY